MSKNGMAGDALRARLDFMGIGPAERQALKTVAPRVREKVGTALDLFHDRVRATPQTRRFFADRQSASEAPRTVAMIEENSAASRALARESEALAGLVGRFRIAREAALLPMAMSA